METTRSYAEEFVPETNIHIGRCSEWSTVVLTPPLLQLDKDSDTKNHVAWTLPPTPLGKKKLVILSCKHCGKTITERLD